MNRADARQSSVVINMPGGVVDDPQKKRKQPAPKRARLYLAHGAELIGHVVIFQHRQLVRVNGINAGRDFRIGTLMAAKLNEEDRGVDQQERSQQQKQ